jgi:hypothetical protein
MSDLRVAAETYRELGWQVVPVVDKRPRVNWKNPPSRDRVEPFWDDPATTGLAVILGAPSGDLVVRDFDKPEAFDQWKEEHPDLAQVLPIARTGRPGGGYHAYGTLPEAPLLKLKDGELRGNGAIVVLPPSLHHSGSRYEWINPPCGQPRLVTMEELHVISDSGLHPSPPQATPKQTQANPSIAYVEQKIKINKCIVNNLPSGPGQRNRYLFRLAQHLREFLPKDTPVDDLLVIVRQWHACALPFIQTKEILESIADFLTAWGRIQWPKGTAWCGIVEEAKHDVFSLGSDLGELDPAARILRALSRRHRGTSFPLSLRKLAGALGVSCPKTAQSRMRVLEAMGYVEIVKKGDPKPGGEATVWRWTGPMD